MKDEIIVELIRQNAQLSLDIYEQRQLLLSLLEANGTNVRKLIALQLKIPATQLYKKWKGCSLVEAKKIVDEISYGEEESKVF